MKCSQTRLILLVFISWFTACQSMQAQCTDNTPLNLNLTNGLTYNNADIVKTGSQGWNDVAVCQQPLPATDEGSITITRGTNYKIFGFGKDDQPGIQNIQYGIRDAVSRIDVLRGYSVLFSFQPMSNTTTTLTVEKKNGVINYLVNSQVFYSTNFAGEDLKAKFMILKSGDQIENPTYCYGAPPPPPPPTDSTACDPTTINSWIIGNNLVQSGSTITKNAGGAGWNAVAYSDPTTNDAWTEMRLGNPGFRILGFGTSIGPGAHEVEFGVFLNWSDLQVRESGNVLTTIPNISPSAMIRIEKKGSQFELLVDGNSSYTYPASNANLRAKVFCFDQGVTITDINFCTNDSTITNPSNGNPGVDTTITFTPPRDQNKIIFNNLAGYELNNSYHERSPTSNGYGVNYPVSKTAYFRKFPYNPNQEQNGKLSTWKAFEPSMGNYTMEPFRKFLKDLLGTGTNSHKNAAAHLNNQIMNEGGAQNLDFHGNMKCSFRLLTQESGYNIQVPSYLPTINAPNGEVLEWNQYTIQRHRLLLDAIYNYLSNPDPSLNLPAGKVPGDYIAYIDIGSVGNYGEWHNSGYGVNASGHYWETVLDAYAFLPDKNEAKQIIDDYINVFQPSSGKHFQLVSNIGVKHCAFVDPAIGSNYPANEWELMEYALRTGEVGWRDDGFGGDWNAIKVCEMLDWSTANNGSIHDAWKENPVVMEAYGTFYSWPYASFSTDCNAWSGGDNCTPYNNGTDVTPDPVCGGIAFNQTYPYNSYQEVFDWGKYDLHMSMLHGVGGIRTGSTQLESDLKQAMISNHKGLGYRLEVPKVTIKSKFDCSNDLEVKVDLKNVGNASFFSHAWNHKLEVFYGTVKETIVIPKLLPNATRTLTLNLAGDAEYSGPIYLKVKDNIGAIQLINTSEQTDYSYTIGNINITCSNGLVTLDTRMFLEGAISDTTMFFGNNTNVMSSALASLNLIPTYEPYGVTNQPHTIASFGANTIDWVQVDLRLGSNVNTVVASVPGFLLGDGTIVSTDGMTPIQFSGLQENSYFLALKHRNHFSVMTVQPVVVDASGNLVYDFTQANHNYAQREVSPGVWAVIGGDCEQDDSFSFDINGADKIKIWEDNGQFNQYLNSDLNLDGETSGQDLILFHQNNGMYSHTPK